jgi:hypothetical protein
MFSHRFRADTLIFVVVLECKRILGILSLIRNLLLDFWEIFIAHGHFEVAFRFYTAGGVESDGGVLGKGSLFHKRSLRIFISSNKFENRHQFKQI